MHRIKFTAIILAGILTLLSLSGCGQKKALFLPQNADTNQADVAVQVAKPSYQGGQ